MSKRLLSLLFSVLLACPALAQEPQAAGQLSPVPPQVMLPDHRPSRGEQRSTGDEQPFYEGRKQGWYWYKDEHKKPK